MVQSERAVVETADLCCQSTIYRMAGRLIGAIDQGTTSTRFLLFDCKSGRVVAQHQQEYPSIYPHAGYFFRYCGNARWCEQDPLVIVQTVWSCISGACLSLPAGYSVKDVAAIGITNQVSHCYKYKCSLLGVARNNLRVGQNDRSTAA